MPRLTISARLGALAIALLLPMFAWSLPAHADAPPTATVTLHASGGTLEEDTTFELAAQASAYPVIPTGTFTYRDGNGDVIGTGEALPGGGTYPINVVKPSVPTTYTVDFHSTNGYADGTASVLYTPKYRKTVTVTPQPTLLKIGTGLVPQLTLTMAETFKLKDGTGVAGYKLSFYLLCDGSPRRDCGINIPICQATSDANGLASCKGSGALGAIVSILTGAVQVTGYDAVPARDYNYVWTSDKFPVIATG